MSKTPKYYAIYQSLQKDIQSGAYPVGENLPTDKTLADYFDVSIITIKKAMELLSNEGYIVRKPRKGTTVCNTTPAKRQILDNSHLRFGLITTNFTDFFGTSILRSILSTSDELIDFVVKISYGDINKEADAISELIASGVQGLIILPTSSEYISPKLLELISQNFPVVVIDRLMGELPIPSVRTDNEAASKALTQLLIEKGHKKIGMVTSDNHVTTIDERISGFISAHLNNHLPFSNKQIISTIDSVVPNSKVTIENDVTVIKQFLENNSDLTAVIASEYNIALLVQRAAKEMDRQIPENLSLACFDSPAFNPFEEQPFIFTHVEQKQEELGRTAVDLLIKKCKEPTFIEKTTLGFSLVEGNSTEQNKNH